MTTPARLLVIVLFEGVDVLDVTGPSEVFALLRREMDGADGDGRLPGGARRRVHGTRHTFAGVRVLPDLTFAEAATRRIDTPLMPGAVETEPDERGAGRQDDLPGLPTCREPTWTPSSPACLRRRRSGVTKPHANRMKMLKRRMSGRADCAAVPRKRVLRSRSLRSRSPTTGGSRWQWHRRCGRLALPDADGEDTSRRHRAVPVRAVPVSSA